MRSSGRAACWWTMRTWPETEVWVRRFPMWSRRWRNSQRWCSAVWAWPFIRYTICLCVFFLWTFILSNSDKYCVCFRCWQQTWRNKLLSCKRKNFLFLHQSSIFLISVRGKVSDEAPVVNSWMTVANMWIVCRLYNYEPLTPLRTLRASVFGRLVCVKGTVVRVSNIRPLCTRMAFRCQTCSSTMSLPLQHGKYATPTKVQS